MSVGAKIAGARKARGWSQARLADAINQAQTTISSWERERTEPTRSDVARVASVLGVPVSTLEIGSDERRPQSRTVPLVGYVGAGAVAHYYASADEGLGEVEAPEDATANTVAAEIRGTSLGPALDRWLVFYDDVRSPVTPDLHGELCVVGLPTDQILVKVLRPTGDPQRFHLISNGAEEPLFDQPVVWAAKVKGMRPR